MIPALVVPNFTDIGLLRFLPIIATLLPGKPLVGVKLSIFGKILNMVAPLAVPPGVVTFILPVVAPNGTVALMEVAETTLKIVALTPLNCTAATPVKFVPAIVTTVPTGPLVGVKLVIAGRLGAVTVKAPVLVAMPTRFITVIFPFVAPS